MWALICLIFVIFSSALAGPAVLNSTNGSLSPRIIGGEIPIKTSIYEVAVVSEGVSPVQLCSGVLIKTKWVLTSAYCAKSQSVLRVIAGTAIIDPITIGDGKFVERVYSHPYYNALYNLHDIALLYVPDISSTSTITLASLPSYPNRYDEYVGQNGVISGFGVDASNSPTPMYGLKYKQVQIINNDYCLQEGFFMNYYKLCTGGQAVCLGDSGGPLIIGTNVVGIASIALKAYNCESQVCTTYTRVNYYRNWIDQTIKSCG